MRGYRVYVLMVLSAIGLFSSLDRVIIGAVAGSIKKEFGLTDAQLGIPGTAFVVLTIIGLLPFGIWADRGARRIVIGVGVGVWSLFTGLAGLAHSFPQLVLARAGVGLGEASYYPAGIALVSDYFPKGARARAMSVINAANFVGVFIAFTAGGALAARAGWRAAFLLAGLPGLLLAVVALKLREPLRGAAEARGPRLESVHDASASTIVGLLRIRTLVALIVVSCFYQFVVVGFSFWLPTYLGRRFAMGPAQAGGLAGVTVGIGGVLGVVVGGWLSDWLLRHTPRAHLLVSVAAFTGGAAAYAIAFSTGSAAVFAIFAGLSVLSTSTFVPAGQALIQNIVVPSLRASAVTVYLLVGSAFAAAAPIVIGRLSDQLHSLAGALQLIAVATLLAAAASAAAGLSSVARDTAAMEEDWARRGAEER